MNKYILHAWKNIVTHKHTICEHTTLKESKILKLNPIISGLMLNITQI